MTLGPITNTFRELNDLLLNQQQWRAQMDARKQEFGLQSAMMEQDVKDRIMQRKFDEYKMKEIEDYYTPKDVGMLSMVQKNPITEKHIYNNPKVMKQLAAIYDPTGEKGLTYSPADDTWRESSGKVFQLSNKDLADKAPALTGIIDANTDTMQMHMDAAAHWEAEYAKEAKKLDKIPGGHKGVRTDRGKIMAKPIRERLLEIQKKIDYNTAQFTPEKQLKYYRDKKLMMSQRMAWANSIGDKNLAQFFQSAVQDAADGEQLVMKALLAGKSDSEGKNIIQRTAVLLGDDGSKIAEVVLNVPKNDKGPLVPQDYGAPAGYVWSEMFDPKATGSGSDQTLSIVGKLREDYGRYDEKGQFFAYEHLNEIRYRAEGYVGQLRAQYPKLNNTQILDMTREALNNDKRMIAEEFESLWDGTVPKEKIPEEEQNLLNDIQKMIGWGPETVAQILDEAGYNQRHYGKKK